MSEDPAAPKQEPGKPNPYGVALGIGTELVTCVLLGFFAGQWLDKKLDTGPWLMLLATMSGIGLGLYQLIRATNKRP